ncbi:protein of unknown function [Candidatus Methylacidiphilum fumarolicum]|uniref:Uncharacterized protein n=1 Tax=Candidatus Methylacidiphilum fumarolicum TaxID=591154 RepID=A0ABM9IDS5_9BACT|nr:protein of unknown function [Candidatus Methylacidiphilum fumarolicum]
MRACGKSLPSRSHHRSVGTKPLRNSGGLLKADHLAQQVQNIHVTAQERVIIMETVLTLILMLFIVGCLGN